MSKGAIRILLVFAFTSLGTAQLPLRQLLVGQGTEALGSSLAAVGDLDGDQVADLLLGAPLWDASSQGLGSGRVLVLSGADLSLIRSHEGSVGEQLGFALCALGDIDGDGVDDYALGAPGASRVDLHSGLTGTLIRSETRPANEGCGHVLARIPDLDGDGRDELVLGLPRASVLRYEDGRILIISGQSGALLLDRHGDSAGDGFGSALLAVGDADGDGLADLAVTAPRDDLGGTDAGTAYLLSSQTGFVLAQVSGNANAQRLGDALAALDDLDADGMGEIAIGVAAGGPQSQGQVLIWSPGPATILQTLTGVQAYARFGSSLTSGDFNGDGLTDLAVASPYGTGSASLAGRVSVFRGPGFNPAATFLGHQSFDLFGFALLGLGDLDGDGIDELGIGALGSDLGGTNSGAFAVYSMMGSRRYGLATGPLSLDLAPSPPATVTHLLRVRDGKPAAQGTIAVSFGAADFQAFGLQILIDWSPAVFALAAEFVFDLSGEVSFPLNLRAPWLDGINLYLQAYDRDFPFAASAGLELRFGI